jgi:hypothetical protein
LADWNRAGGKLQLASKKVLKHLPYACPSNVVLSLPAT